MPVLLTPSVKALFIHIPKTGGSSIVKWLGSSGCLGFHSDSRPAALTVSMQHLTYRELKLFFPKDYFDFSFCIVRNPFDRIKSEYYMRRALRKEAYFKADLDFSTWLHESIENTAKNSMHMDNHIRPQWHFVGGDVKFYKFESGMAHIIKDISARISIAEPVQTPHVYNSKMSREPFKWDPVDVRLIREFYAGDFEMFKYADALE